MFRLKLHLHGAEIQDLQLDNGREYTFGRGENCDVQLAEGKSISRVHFKVVEENGQWTAKVVSKFGAIQQSGSSTNHLALDVGMVFKLGPYDFTFLELAKQEVSEQAPVSNTLPMAVGQNGVTGFGAHGAQAAVLDANGHAAGFVGNDEATRVANYEPEIPFLRMVESGGRSEEIKLEGRRWIAGREDGCNILLNDRKSSRRQFELSSTPQGFFIRDLGSSNGTLLNGMQLAPDELKAIRSGDVIQVGAAVLHFEVRDPHFNTKLMVVPPQNRSDYGIIVQSPYEMINYPVVQGPGGAVRMDGNNWMQTIENLPVPFTDGMDEAKKKKARFYFFAAILLVPLVLVLMFTGGDPPKKVATK